MDKVISITDSIYWIGVNDRQTDLFEALWPLPKGVAYNSYLIIDEKVTIVDTVKNNYIDSYIRNIKGVLGDREVDYLVINHMEPDHSGAIKAIKDAFPNIKIVGNKKTLAMIEGFYGLNDGGHLVGDGDELDLGGRKLKFYLTPMVHWPETMMTYDQKDKILFSGDAFGGFGTLDGGIFDDQLNIAFYEDEISRYFTNIVGKYSQMVLKAIDKLKDLDIGIVASTHGPIWRQDPNYIINKYSKWSKHQTEEGVVIAYGSMYGNTERLVEHLARELAQGGIKNIRVYNVSKTHISYIINDIWRYKGLVLASCTYNTGIFPYIDNLLRFLENKKIKNHILGLIGSYSWSGESIDRLTDFGGKVGIDPIQPIVELKQGPTDLEFEKVSELAINLIKTLKE
ncbi:FprA family A-type flavoprotein [Halonatronum saccharophilum]|uniref:FprA family A-type flavoprotein n=1 Tax=Halonatronum saccharophilum TaxID=150060 RepID=UPI000485C6ED|nr:FprA family A-type flavoprotein [Halonatronum saccharophilum]